MYVILDYYKDTNEAMLSLKIHFMRKGNTDLTPTYEGDSKSQRKSAAKLLVFMGNSRSLYMLYINILLIYAQKIE